MYYTYSFYSSMHYLKMIIVFKFYHFLFYKSTFV
nr:MAG TPA: hypothetical protein [Caudoviricetes sp.]